MTREPTNASGMPMSEWIARIPGGLNDIPVGMWRLVPTGRLSFALEGPALISFLRRSIHSLMDAGANPISGPEKPNQWKLEVKYGSNKHQVAEAVIQEWLREGAPTPKPWTGLWFGLPWCWLPEDRR